MAVGGGHQERASYKKRTADRALVDGMVGLAVTPTLTAAGGSSATLHVRTPLPHQSHAACAGLSHTQAAAAPHAVS